MGKRSHVNHLCDGGETGNEHPSGGADFLHRIIPQEPDERADVAEYDMYNIMEENDQLRAKIEVKRNIKTNEYGLSGPQ